MRWGAVAATAVALTVPASVWACGPNPDAFWTLGSHFPVDGARGVPRDAVAVLRLRPYTAVYPERGGSEAHGMLRVRVVDAATRTEVPGQLLPWYGTSPAAAVWKPDVPFAADATYELDAVVVNRAPALPEAQAGALAMKATFTTGGALAAPVRARAPMTVVHERYQRPVYPSACTGPCGGPPTCGPSRTVSAQRLKLTIPGLQGGIAEAGYEVLAWAVRGEAGSALNQDDLARFRTATGIGDQQGFAVVDGAAPATLTLELGDETASRWCVFTRVFDATKRAHEPEPACVDLRAPLAEAGGGGCAVGGAGGPLGWCAWALPAVALLLRPRRRR